MANKKVIITRTVQFPTEKGLVELVPSEEPQAIDAELAKEGIERGWAKEPAKAAKKAAAKAPDADSGAQTNPDGDQGSGSE